MLITANVLLENTNSRFSFCCALRAVKYSMDLTLHEGLTKILLNSGGDLNGIYSGAFRCAEEKVLLLPELPGMGIGCGTNSCMRGNWLENSIHCIGWDTLKMAGAVWKHKSGMSAPQEIYF